MTESYGFKDSYHSCRLSDKSASPVKPMRYKCYSCGTNAYQSSKCSTCHGLKYVTETNSMVGLLLQVMYCKLGKDVHTIQKFPVLQFSAQPRKEPKKYTLLEIFNELEPQKF